MRTCFLLAIVTLLNSSMNGSSLPGPSVRLALWPGVPPGSSEARGPEHKVEGRPRPFYQLTDISKPSLEVFAPSSGKANGTAILVCPGGGLQRLAYEHEGLEVAAWLNSLGITAVVLKYRVPASADTALLDAQRAMGLIRKNARDWNIQENSLGVMGFSAGGEIAAWLMTHSEKRAYEKLDDADDISCRPDFSVIVYPGGLIQRDGSLKSELSSGLSRGIAPVFLTHAFDDGAENSLQLAMAMKKALLPCELHLYQEGAHGFGARKTGVPVGTWKDRFVDWMNAMGQLDKPHLRHFSESVVQALESGKVPPSFSADLPEATLMDAYRVQRRVVQRQLGHRVVAGYKGGAATESAQKTLTIDRPFIGVLFGDGWLKDAEKAVLKRNETGPLAVETEIGFVMGADFSGEILTDEQAKDFVDYVVPVVELPLAAGPASVKPDARDMVAINVSSAKFITGPRLNKDKTNLDSLEIKLLRDGRPLHETSGGIVNGGQWHNLRMILNSITANGYTIRAGSLIICGALGGAHQGEPGHYEARFGNLTPIQFEIQ